MPIRDLTGKIQSWIDIGTPDGARLHKASKTGARVAVYCHKEGAQWLNGLASANIHRADALQLFAIDRHADRGAGVPVGSANVVRGIDFGP